MANEQLSVQPEIGKAHTLPGAAYRDPDLYERARATIFARSWQLAGDLEHLKSPGTVHPLVLLEGCLDEPLVLTRDAEDRIRCLSNVCTHRANLVVEHPGRCRQLRCRYHGRRFGLDGRFVSMPEFEGVCDFPSPADDLTELPVGRLGPLLFTSLEPPCGLEELLAPVVDRVGWLELDQLTFDPSRSRDYLVRANWALYCDNYLEGFHIPFVHSGLAEALDYGAYRVELFRHASLQVGVAAGGEEVFDLPSGSPDAGQAIAAYYFFLFPNTMLNVYPWGVSVNVVKPLAVDRTRVSFLTYVLDRSRLDRGAGAALDRVEREDEEVVESVQRGVGSRFYDRGRYSPQREPAVHHFHRLLADRLSGGK